MGKLTTTSQDTADRVVEAQLNAVGDASPPVEFTGTFNLAVWATASATGSVEIEKTFDGGTTWLRASNLGEVPAIPAGMTEVLFGRENGVLWRAKRVSGTGAAFFVRLSQ